MIYTAIEEKKSNINNKEKELKMQDVTPLLAGLFTS